MQFDSNQLLQQSPLAIVVSDNSDRILWCNDLFLKQTILDRKDVVGHLYESLPLEAIDKNAQNMLLFSNEKNKKVTFQYWQEKYHLLDDKIVHYYVLERNNTENLKNLSGKLKNYKLPKRASWVDFLDYEVSRSRRYENPLSILKLHILVFEDGLTK